MHHTCPLTITHREGKRFIKGLVFGEGVNNRQAVVRCIGIGTIGAEGQGAVLASDAAVMGEGGGQGDGGGSGGARSSKHHVGNAKHISAIGIDDVGK